eukprot:8973795-Alexandrium_andersonii.AAC.1
MTNAWHASGSSLSMDSTCLEHGLVMTRTSHRHTWEMAPMHPGHVSHRPWPDTTKTWPEHGLDMT